MVEPVKLVVLPMDLAERVKLEEHPLDQETMSTQI